MLDSQTQVLDLDRFVAEDYTRVVSAVARITGNHADAQDAVQEALVSLLRLDRPVGSVAAWVTVAASNRARSGRRRLGAEERAVGRLGARLDPEPERLPELDLRRALAALPLKQRQAATLHYYLGQPVAEVAVALGVSEGTVKTHLSRARASLARALGVEEESHE